MESNSQHKLRPFYLLVLINSGPSLLFLLMGNIDLMVSYFKVAFSLSFIYLVIRTDPFFLIGFTITQFPLVFFLKGAFYFYFITTALMLFVCIWLFISKSGFVKTVLSNKRFLFLFSFFILYFIISLIMTKEYSSGMKFIDLALSMCLVPFIFGSEDLFKKTFLMFGLNAVLFALIIGVFDARLLDSHSAILEDIEIGGANPIGYGIPVALFLLLLLVSPERVIPQFFITNLLAKIILIGITVIALIVTTSRGSIFALTAGLFAFLIVKPSVRSVILPVFFLLIGIFLYFLSSKYIPQYTSAEKFLVGRLNDPRMNLNKYSSNRLKMWEAVVEEVRSGNFIFLGTGPGKESTAQFSSGYKLKKVFHALPLKFVIEIGLVLTGFFYIVFFSLIWSKIGLLRRSNFPLPLMGAVFWFGITLSVAGTDILSGLALGFTFLSPNDI